jgi:hypothetical protein
VVYLLRLYHLNYPGVMMYGCEHLRPQRHMLLLALDDEINMVIIPYACNFFYGTSLCMYCSVLVHVFISRCAQIHIVSNSTKVFSSEAG